MPKIDTWAAVDDLVLGVFRDGHARTTDEVSLMVPDLTRHEIHHALDVLAQQGRLAAGECTYQITEAGRRHLTNLAKAA